MPDDFSGYAEGLGSPADNAAAVTPSNTVDLTNFSRALYIGAVGDVKVDMVNGGTVTFVAVPTGTVLPVRVSRVYDTGTGASSIVALW